MKILCFLLSFLLPLSAFAQAPTTPEQYCQKGLAKADKGDFEGALIDYDAAISLNPQYAAAYSARGHAKLVKRDLNGAIADFDIATRLDPQNGFPFGERGIAEQAKGELDHALLDYDQAIKLRPTEAIGYYDRGNVEEAKGDLNGAIADFDRAIELKPTYAKAYANRASVEFRQGDLLRGQVDSGKAHSLDSNYSGSEPPVPKWLSQLSAPEKAALDRATENNDNTGLVTQHIIPPDKGGDGTFTISIVIKHAGFLDFQLPVVDGLRVSGTSTSTVVTQQNGSVFMESFAVTPLHPGDFTIPAFDVHVPNGQVLHVQKMELHVADKATPDQSSASPVHTPTQQTNSQPPPNDQPASSAPGVD